MSASASAWLKQLPALQGCRLERRLANGPTSEKWLCVGVNQRYVLRVDRPLAARLQLNRDAEFKLLQDLAAESLVPMPVTSAAGAMVTHFQEGRVWTRKDLDEPANLILLANALRKLHSVDIPAAPLRLADKLRNYAALSNSAASATDCDRALSLLSAARPEGSVICHNDPVLGNILGDGAAILIDWEYAAAGNRHFDLAAVIEHHGLGEAAQALLLAGYGQSVALDAAEVERWRKIYRLTQRLWMAAVTP